MPVQTEETEDYKSKYKNLKRKLKILIYENECFQEELAKANRALLRVRQDKSFLLDQLLPHHQPPASSSDSDLTDNSDNETSVVCQALKRKRVAESSSGTASSPSVAYPHIPHSTGTGPTRISPSVGKVGNKTSASSSKQCGASNSGGGKPASSLATVPPAAGRKRGTALPIVRAGSKQPNRSNNRQRRAPQKLPKSHLSQSAMLRGLSNSSNCTGQAADSMVTVSGIPTAVLERELSREEVERHLMARQTITDFSTPVSLTLPHQLFSDNILDGDLLEEIETSPSNMEEDISVDNYD